MKQNRRRLECIWRWNLADYNQKAVRIATKVRADSRAHFAVQISKASNQELELFRIVHDLSGIGLSNGPPTSISPDQFEAFLKSKVEAIHQELSPFLNTVD